MTQRPTATALGHRRDNAELSIHADDLPAWVEQLQERLAALGTHEPLPVQS